MRLRLAGQVCNVVRKPDGAWDVDGTRVEAEAIETRRPRAFVAREGDQVFAQVGERSYRLAVVSRAAASAVDHSAAEGELEAPMPGRVTRIAVAVGERVKRGQELIVVEAMKMENALIAPSDGVVRSLAVSVGDMVAPGPALVVIEAAQ